VYDIFTLIAEVSGFADLFVILFSTLIGSLYSPKALDTEIINRMDFKVKKKQKKKVHFTQ
jgi:hypothetical protein